MARVLFLEVVKHSVHNSFSAYWSMLLWLCLKEYQRNTLASGSENSPLLNLHFHDLRHEATSRFLELGLNVVEVAAITGHKDLKMLQRYTHLRAEDLARKLQ